MSFPNKYAVLVGINYVGTSAQLSGCVSDIVNIRNMLIDAYGYNPANIVMLREDSSVASLTPTKSNILMCLKALMAKSSIAGTEEIWFHYSGHGSQIRDNNGDESDKLDEVIVPLDYTKSGFITDDEFRLIVKGATKSLTDSCRFIFLFDSCHSGSMLDLPYAVNTPSGPVTTLNAKDVWTYPNIVAFSGCRDAQTSADTFSALERQACGAFTNAFITSLRKIGHAGISVANLHTAVCTELASRKYSQVSVISSSSIETFNKMAMRRYNGVNTIGVPSTTATTTSANTGNTTGVVVNNKTIDGIDETAFSFAMVKQPAMPVANMFKIHITYNN